MPHPRVLYRIVGKIDSLNPISQEPLLFVGGLSRSGTTLLTAVLDAHRSCVMGAELIPPRLPRPSVVLRAFENAMRLADGDYKTAGSKLKTAGDAELGQFLTRCYRAGIGYGEAKSVLAHLDADLSAGITTLRDRLLLAWSLMRTRWLSSGRELFGFKLNTAAIASAAALFPNARFLCIVRYPYDVVCSQVTRGFKRSVADMASAWLTYARNYLDFGTSNPSRCAIIRYEDLVRSPRRTLANALTRISIPSDEAMFEFYKSDSAIHDSHHPNAVRLRMNFTTDSIGSGRARLPERDIKVIYDIAAKMMRVFGYGNASLMCGELPPVLCSLRARPTDNPTAIKRIVAAKHHLRLRKMHRFKPQDYESMLAPYLSSHRNLRLIDFFRIEDAGDNRFLLIRHDIDHDIEMAVKLAGWEHRHNIKSTYCILHSAWYYGALANGGYKHSNLLLDCVEQIASYGHEINFHNNVVAVALTHGIDPAALLERELDFFDRRGLPIVGTATHGDPLCRQMNFRNWELFRECCDDRYGGPRSISYTDTSGRSNSIALGQLSMFDFGLEYEAYDIARDVYHTDSGGNIRTRLKTRGRRDFGRQAGRGEIVGVLTHPEWWGF